MTHVITRSCCNDAACVSVCPTNCIHPAPGDPDFMTAEMLNVDPANCIDCGACVEVCPVDAIKPEAHLEPDELTFRDLNRRYFEGRSYDRPGFFDPPTPAARTDALNVAVVGSGPAAMYAVEHLLDRLGPDAAVHVYERLPTPWGLVRYGVAPDHQDTKQVVRGFERVADDPRVHVHLNVEVGRDVTHQDVAAHHHAVVYGVGAPQPRTLAVPGEELEGCIAATAFVGWYNGHPDHVALQPDLTGRRAVVVGNGNVALDVARVLAAGDEQLNHSDISEPALAALRTSGIEEIVVLGRRGPAEAAYTTPELLSLLHVPGVEVVAQGAPDLDLSAARVQPKVDLVQRTVSGEFTPDSAVRRRVLLRYLGSPIEVLGDGRVEAVRIARNRLESDEHGVVRARATSDTEDLPCSLLIHAVGYRGSDVPGLPLDESGTLVPNQAGRVVDGGTPRPGVYVVGWSKRGPSGVIGTNKACAAETVQTLLDDADAGELPEPRQGPEALLAGLGGKVDLTGWRRLDRHEREAGRAADRPRVKVVGHASMLEVVHQ